MKTISSVCKTLLLLIMIAVINIANAQNKKADKTPTIKTLIENNSFVFHPQTALPMSSGAKQITPDFELMVSKDTIVSYLPYYGRAYTAGYGSTESPLNFRSTKFDYTVTPKHKGGWDIIIKTKDNSENIIYTLSISADGYGILQATSDNRQPISFNGYITERKTN